MSGNSSTVALFRAREDALASAAALAARGLAAAIAPVTEISALDAEPPPGPFEFIVATSAKAITLASPEALAAARQAPLYVVGETTAAAARGMGLTPAPAADEVAALLPTLPQGRALYLAGADRRPELEAALGARLATLVVYEARAREGWDEAEADAVATAQAALHYSQRGAALATEFALKANLANMFRRIPHVCMSRQAAAPLAAFGVTRALWPRRPAEPALLDTLESALADFAGL
jgi:uroporphyrinogen-III synthase